MRANQQTGFSLISIVLSIILISFALITLTVLLFPRAQDNAQLIHSTKAAELGAAVMDEIIGRKYDENSGPNGGEPECNSSLGKTCTAPDQLGPDTTEVINGIPDRTLFNDVDDFNGLSGSVKDVLGDDLAQVYPNFSISIHVFYNANINRKLDGVPDVISGNNKRIVVDVTDPSRQHYVFSVIRGNF
jgi:MSHA pilin protein MshD